MSKAIITEASLTAIGNAIRGKLGVETTYKPGDMAAAILSIPSGITPSGTISIGQNGTYDVTQYASAAVDVSGGDDGYTKPGLMFRFDGINNTGTGHDANASAWADISGNGYTASLYNTTWESDAIRFNGTNAYAEGPFLYCNDKTVEVVFMRLGDASGSYSGVISDLYVTSGSSSTGFDVTVRTSKMIAIQTYNGTVDSGVTCANNVAYYVAITKEANTLKIYVNGVLCNSSVQSINQFARAYQIGRRGQSADLMAWFNGLVHHAAVYARALSAEEISRNYNYLADRFSMT